MNKYLVTVELQIKSSDDEKAIKAFLKTLLEKEYQGTEYRSKITKLDIYKTTQTTGFQVE